MELYRKIHIKSEADLPKEEALYYCSYNDKIIWMWHRKKDWNIKDWLDNVNWYLEPIEITDADIEAWDACPCKILDKPCKHNCSCVEKFSSAGCNYCSTYGSKEQRKQMAEYLKRKIDFYMPTDKDIEAYYPVTSSHQMDTNSWNNRLRQEGAKAVLNNEIKHIEK